MISLALPDDRWGSTPTPVNQLVSIRSVSLCACTWLRCLFLKQVRVCLWLDGRVQCRGSCWPWPSARPLDADPVHIICLRVLLLNMLLMWNQCKCSLRFNGTHLMWKKWNCRTNKDTNGIVDYKYPRDTVMDQICFWICFICHLSPKTGYSYRFKSLDIHWHSQVSSSVSHSETVMTSKPCAH